MTDLMARTQLTLCFFARVSNKYIMLHRVQCVETTITNVLLHYTDYINAKELYDTYYAFNFYQAFHIPE